MKPRVFQALLCSIAFALALSWAGLGIPLSAENVAVVRLDPAEVSVAPGEIAEVSVWIDDVVELYGAEIHLSFDPTILRIEDADTGAAGVQIEPGPLLDPAQGFIAANQVDHERGELVYAITLMAPAMPVSGSGELARFNIVGEAPGRSDWKWDNVILATREGNAISVEAQMAWVTVRGGQAPTVTSIGGPPSPLTTTATASSPSPSPSAASPDRSQTPAPSTAPPVASQTPAPSAANAEAPAQPTFATAPAPTPATSAFTTATTASMPSSAPWAAVTPDHLGALSETQTAVLPSARVTDATPETVAQAPSTTVEPTPSAPQEVVPTSALDEKGASLSALPAILAALVVILTLFIGRRLLRRRRE